MFKKFQEACQAFHSQLEHCEFIEESGNCYGSVLNQIKHLKKTEFWLAGVEASKLRRSFEKILMIAYQTLVLSLSYYACHTHCTILPVPEWKAAEKQGVLNAHTVLLKRLHERKEEL